MGARRAYIFVLGIILLVVSCAPKTIGPILTYEPLGAEMYSYGIDKNNDGCVDFWEIRAWDGEKLMLIERQPITHRHMFCDQTRLFNSKKNQDEETRNMDIL